MYDGRTGVGGPPPTVTQPAPFLYDSPLQDRTQQQQINNNHNGERTNIVITPNNAHKSSLPYLNSASFLRTTTPPLSVTNTPPQEISRQDIYPERPPFFAESNQR
jgi:hypothetical protein